MTEEELRAVCERIRQESTYWDDQQTALHGVRENANDLFINVDPLTFIPLKYAVEGVICDMQTQLWKGETEFSKIAGALITNAEAYERHDAEASERIQNAY